MEGADKFKECCKKIRKDRANEAVEKLLEGYNQYQKASTVLRDLEMTGRKQCSVVELEQDRAKLKAMNEAMEATMVDVTVVNALERFAKRVELRYCIKTCEERINSAVAVRDQNLADFNAIFERVPRPSISELNELRMAVLFNLDEELKAVKVGDSLWEVTLPSQHLYLATLRKVHDMKQHKGTTCITYKKTEDGEAGVMEYNCFYQAAFRVGHGWVSRPYLFPASVSKPVITALLDLPITFVDNW